MSHILTSAPRFCLWLVRLRSVLLRSYPWTSVVAVSPLRHLANHHCNNHTCTLTHSHTSPHTHTPFKTPLHPTLIHLLKYHFTPHSYTFQNTTSPHTHTPSKIPLHHTLIHHTTSPHTHTPYHFTPHSYTIPLHSTLIHLSKHHFIPHYIQVFSIPLHVFPLAPVVGTTTFSLLHCLH